MRKANLYRTESRLTTKAVMHNRRKFILKSMTMTSVAGLTTAFRTRHLIADQHDADAQKEPRTTLEDLQKFNAFVREQFKLPRYYDPGVGALGLILGKLGEDAYRWCTPVNCLTFARTGGNGVHFSFLTLDRKKVSQSPIVLTNPGGGDGRSWIVGKDLHDFLSFGYHCGYFVMEQLAYSLKEAIETFVNPESPVADKELLLSEERTPVMKSMRERFGLKPWKSVDQFHDLQEKHAGRLEYPPGLKR